VPKTMYSDTEFDVDQDWSLFGPYVVPKDAMDAFFDAQQVPAKDGQDAYLEIALTRATVDEGSVATWAAMINNTMVWNPAENVQGPVGKIDFQIDVEKGGAWSLAVKQGEYVWFALARRAIMTTLDLVHVEIDCLAEADFVALPGSEFVIDGQPLHPDFSADGEPISFGIGVGLSCPSHVSCVVISPKTYNLDNMEVTVRPPFKINAGLNDAWFEPATAGQGILNVVFPDIEQVFMAWFTYDTERPPESVTAKLGEPGHRWLTALGPYGGDTAALDIYLTKGGVFDAVEPHPAPAEAIGNMTIQWCDCEKGKLFYNMPSLGLTGNINLQRIAPDNVALCEALME
jgi:hypothetical protein